MKTLTDTTDSDNKHRIDHLFTVFIDEYQRLSSSEANEDSPMVGIESLVKASMEHGNLSSVYKTLGMSRSSLNRLFQHHHGCSPQAWLQAQRAEKALHLFRIGQHKPQEIAETIGLSTVRSLSRLMLQHTGKNIRDLMGK